MSISAPRFIVAGLSGGAGKTICSLGLTRALANAGHAVKPFKKGPDYIDAVWLGLAAREPATNLDPYFLDDGTLRALFAEKSHGFTMSVIEGNRGLYDGMDLDGSCSTAALSRALDAPVILVMDCTKMTRTAAAVVQGVAVFEDVRLGGVILNRTAGPRHRKILRDAIEHYTDVPVLGALPKMDPDPIPERHMGLISNREYDGQERILDGLAQALAGDVDVERIAALAAEVPPLDPAAPLWPQPAAPAGVRIGYVRDAALWFYYEENLEALERAGAEVVELTLLDDTPWPELDGLYLGGGFPETLAAELAANETIRDHVRRLSLDGLPIYAECGGFMYLAEAVEYQGVSYPMAGVFPVRTEFCAKPQGLGYVSATIAVPNPYHPAGAELRGHEFHYSQCVAEQADGLTMALTMDRGRGMLQRKDGLLRGNTFAGYTHIHAMGAPWWATNFVRAARSYKAGEPVRPAE